LDVFSQIEFHLPQISHLPATPVDFHTRTVQLDITKGLLPTDAQENYLKRSIKIYIKTVPTMKDCLLGISPASEY
jgi:hypothetical protein